MQFWEAKVDFINWLEFIKNKSKKTSEQYLRHLNKFEDYLIATGKNQNHIENIDLKIVNYLNKWEQIMFYDQTKQICPQ